MRPLPPPQIPWQVTGNHWLSLPCIHPADGSVHAIGVLHRGARAAIEFAGGADFTNGTAPALLRPRLRIAGQVHELAAGQIAWERAIGWLPTFTGTVGDLVMRGTIFAPFGQDADVAGAVYAIVLENRGADAIGLTLSLEGMLGCRQQRIRSARVFDDASRVLPAADDVIVLEGAALPGMVALAIGADGPVRVETTPDATTFALHRELHLPPGGREHVAFYIAAGPERDGAEATVAVMRRRGWRELLTVTRDALQALEQSTGNEGIDLLVNRNLLFAYFYAVGRALDDAHFYLVRTRAPWHARGVTIRDWDALAWTIPAVQLADPALARELLIRTCELHGYAPGRGVHYLDGTLFEPGFSLEGASAYALAVDRYIRDTSDDQIVDEPVVADTLYLTSEDIAERRDANVPLYSTEVSPSGASAPHPYTLHGNAVAAQALEILRRTLDEETSRGVEDPEAVRAAIRRHFAVDRDRKPAFASAIDLAGGTAVEDDPIASSLWLPLYDAVERQDSVYRRTVKGLGAQPGHLAQQCARLVGPDAGTVMAWLRRAALDNGVAAEHVDADGLATGNGGDAALSGLLAWTVWYAVHALGARQ